MKRMMKGFTLIELLILIVMLTIVFSIVMNIKNGNNMIMDGSRFGSHTICKMGYVFSVDINGMEQQIFDSNGGGIECIK